MLKSFLSLSLALALVVGCVFSADALVLNKAIIVVKTPFRAVKYIGLGALAGAVAGAALFGLVTKFDWDSDGAFSAAGPIDAGALLTKDDK